jgi:hypothetical protein
MSQPTALRPLRPGLNPRDALDILDIRTREQMKGGATELAAKADVGPDVLHYLAQNGSPVVRAAVAANPAAAALTNRYLADDEDEDVRAELARKVARLMPGLSERENARVLALTIETLECLARDAAVRVRAILAEELGLHSQGGGPDLGARPQHHRRGADPAIFAASVRQ